MSNPHVICHIPRHTCWSVPAPSSVSTSMALSWGNSNMREYLHWIGVRQYTFNMEVGSYVSWHCPHPDYIQCSTHWFILPKLRTWFHVSMNRLCTWNMGCTYQGCSASVMSWCSAEARLHDPQPLSKSSNEQNQISTLKRFETFFLPIMAPQRNGKVASPRLIGKGIVILT